MPLQATSGAASYDAFGGGVAAVPNYIEDVFSTWLIKPPADYTTYSINNGIDLSTKGGMTWFKARDAAQNNLVYDTARGSSSGSPNALITNSTAAQQTAYFDYVTPNTNGFTVNYLSGGGQLTNGGINYASWSFAKAPKFFDIVTYTGDGSSPRTIPHSLGSTPGCIIIKRLDAGGDWKVHHRSISNIAQWLRLETTGALYSNAQAFTSFPDATSFYVGNNNDVNISGGTFVAYLFAHNAGGFGLTGTDNVISCGSFAGDVGAYVNLGYEPQWLLCKRADGAGNWFIVDNMRGFLAEENFAAPTNNSKFLQANTSNAESSGLTVFTNATGFYPFAFGVTTYIYIAIRRGPMKVPTSGTSVFAPILAATSAPVFRASFRLDSVIAMARTGGSHYWGSRLTGTGILDTTSTAAESAYAGETWDYQTSMGNYTSTPADSVGECFQRAPSFFDEVCYTGTGSAVTQAHNLGVVPELMIVKSRSQVNSWAVYLGGPLGGTKTANLDKTYAAYDSSGHWNSTQPTASVFSIGNNGEVNDSGVTYVAYLFATCAGVSKVGSYTGNGTSQVINCGFTSGARFVLIKSTTEARSWCVFDTARGIASGNDPVLYLQATSAEVTSIDWLAPNSSGFEIVTSQGNINGSGQTYIFLAIA